MLNVLAQCLPCGGGSPAPRRFTARLSGGDPLDVELTGNYSVTEAKTRLSEFLYMCPESILVCDSSRGSELDGSRLLRSLTSPELLVVLLNTQDTPLPLVGGRAISARMELSGRILNISLDSASPVDAIRRQIGTELGKGENLLKLTGLYNQVLEDGRFLPETLSELRVFVRSRRNIPLGPLESQTLYTERATISRLEQELRDFDDNAPDGVSAERATDSGTIFCWRVQFPWPENFQQGLDGKGEAIMRFPFNYPFKPPEVYIVQDVQHWAVTPNGKMIMDVLHEQWSPSLRAWAIVASMQSVLNEDSPNHF